MFLVKPYEDASVGGCKARVGSERAPVSNSRIHEWLPKSSQFTKNTEYEDCFEILYPYNILECSTNGVL